jgi:predicted  nucleic acid-binding Zn-ribbon protein
MNEQLNILYALQKFDSEIVRKKNEAEQIPHKINRYTKPLKEAESVHQEEESRYSSLEKKKRQKESDLQEITDRIEKSKERSREIKSNKEYQAHLKEIEKIEKEKYLLEDDILYLMEELDELSQTLSQAMKKIEDEKSILNTHQRDLEQQKSQLEKELSELKDKRASLIPSIQKDLYDSYMDILQKMNGLAVVDANDEVCLGCYMSIPPQLYMEIRTTNEIFQCPQCGRFLYRKDG